MIAATGNVSYRMPGPGDPLSLSLNAFATRL